MNTISHPKISKLTGYKSHRCFKYTWHLWLKYFPFHAKKKRYLPSFRFLSTPTNDFYHTTTTPHVLLAIVEWHTWQQPRLHQTKTFRGSNHILHGEIYKFLAAYTESLKFVEFFWRLKFFSYFCRKNSSRVYRATLKII